MLHTFETQYPIIQAPMAGVTSPKFVAACAEAGILGAIGAGYLDGQQTQTFIQEVKKLSAKPFVVNLFVLEEPRIDLEVLQKARMALQPFYEELGLSSVQSVISKDVFEEQVQAVIDEDVAICSFTFGIPSASIIQRLKEKNTYLIGTATTLEEAKLVEAAGLDAVVLQGSEAGGHRGSFIEPMQFYTRDQLLRQVVGEINIPVIAAGGIISKENIAEALESGASAVQIGTAFLIAEECEINATYKTEVLNSKPQQTTITRAFTGKPARGLINDFTERLKDAVVAPYPLQNHLTTTIRKESMKQGNKEYLSLWMGENSYLAKPGTVKEIVERLI